MRVVPDECVMATGSLGMVPEMRWRTGRITGAGLGRVADDRRAEVAARPCQAWSASMITPTARSRRMYSTAISVGMLPFIRAGIAPSQVSARKLSFASAADVT